MYRATPAALEFEKHALGEALLDPVAAAKVAEKLTEADFFHPRHTVIFEAIRAAVVKGQAIDGVGLQHALEASGRLQDAGGIPYLMEITAEVTIWTNLDHHIATLREYGARRALLGVLAEKTEAAYDLSKPFREVMEGTEAAILKVGDVAKVGGEGKSMARAIKDAAANWEARVKGEPGGLMTGIPALDEILLGLKPGKLYILAARPGLGKSMLAIQIAKQCGRPVAHYSLEMYCDEQVERMVSQVSDLNGESLQSGKLIEAKREALAAAVAELAPLPITWFDESPITPLTILSQCRRLKKRHGLGLIIVDYLQLVESVGKFERRDLEVGFISKFLKNISMKLQVPVLAIASLSRKPEERADKRPVNSDLRESGSIESDADCVIFLYREADYNPAAQKDFPNTTEAIISKHRGGRKGRAILEFDGAHSKFYTTHPESAKRYAAFVGGKNDSAQTRPGYPRKVSGKDAQSSDW